MQAGHGLLQDIASVVLGCTIPNTQSSLWNKSIEVVIIRYTASMAADAVLCNLNRFFEELDIFYD
jgi:hypothetical protein